MSLICSMRMNEFKRSGEGKGSDWWARTRRVVQGAWGRCGESVKGEGVVVRLGLRQSPAMRCVPPTLDHQNLGLKTHNRGETTLKTGQYLACKRIAMRFRPNMA